MAFGLAGRNKRNIYKQVKICIWFPYPKAKLLEGENKKKEAPMLQQQITEKERFYYPPPPQKQTLEKRVKDNSVIRQITRETNMNSRGSKLPPTKLNKMNNKAKLEQCCYQPLLTWNPIVNHTGPKWNHLPIINPDPPQQCFAKGCYPYFGKYLCDQIMTDAFLCNLTSQNILVFFAKKTKGLYRFV